MTGGAQRGGFVVGLMVGLLIGLALALAVALYVTKAPVPFINKVPQRSAEQDAAEAERNKNWDPNAPLAASPAGRGAGRGASAGVGARPAARRRRPRRPPAPAASAAAAGRQPRRPPSADRRRGGRQAGRPTRCIYFVQAGAFASPKTPNSSAPSWRCWAWTAKVTEREQSGRTIYRVRLGPVRSADEAEAVQGKAAGRRRRIGAGAGASANELCRAGRLHRHREQRRKEPHEAP